MCIRNESMDLHNFGFLYICLLLAAFKGLSYAGSLYIRKRFQHIYGIPTVYRTYSYILDMYMV